MHTLLELRQLTTSKRGWGTPAAIYSLYLLATVSPSARAEAPRHLERHTCDTWQLRRTGFSWITSPRADAQKASCAQCRGAIPAPAHCWSPATIVSGSSVDGYLSSTLSHNQVRTRPVAPHRGISTSRVQSTIDGLLVT